MSVNFKRAKIQPRSVLLRAERQLESLLAMLPNLPLDAEHPLEVVIQERSEARGLDQNRLYWLRLGEISLQGWLYHRQYTADVWHIYCGRTVMPETITTKKGEVRSKWLETPDSVPQVISTTELSKASFAEYVTAVEAWAATELGVQFSARPC